jgi:flagellar L-ring protein precursor FlgH
MLRTIAAILIILLASAPAAADSLFRPGDSSDPYSVGLYGKHPPKVERGDILKVRVSERTLADVAVGTDTDTKAEAQMKFENGGMLKRVLDPFFKLLGSGDLKYGSDAKYEADNATNRSAKFEAVITVVVLDVMENGNVVIEGRKKLKVNNENEYLLVRGEVNPKDISPDLVIESENIANAEIEYIGEGQLSKRQKPGFITQLIHTLF